MFLNLKLTKNKLKESLKRVSKNKQQKKSKKLF